MKTSEPGTGRLLRVALPPDASAMLTPMCDADRAQAVADLEIENSFVLCGAQAEHTGPYILHLGVQEGRLILDIRDQADQTLTVFGLALGPFRRLMKDYALMLDSYAEAAQNGAHARIQAIDMGRRGLHNEGATLLRERLSRHVSIDFDTARRLFTLVCTLHQKT